MVPAPLTVVQGLLLQEQWSVIRAASRVDSHTFMNPLYTGLRSQLAMTTVSCQQARGDVDRDAPVPGQERYRSDEEKVPAWILCLCIAISWLMTHPMLDPRSLPPPLAPAVRMNTQAIMLITRVPKSTSHSWNSRVTVGCDACGISSLMEWKIRGKTVAGVDEQGANDMRSEVRTWREIVSAIAADIVCLCSQLLLSACQVLLPTAYFLQPCLFCIGR